MSTAAFIPVADMLSALWPLPVDEHHVERTASVVPTGTYCFLWSLSQACCAVEYMSSFALLSFGGVTTYSTNKTCRYCDRRTPDGTNMLLLIHESPSVTYFQRRGRAIYLRNSRTPTGLRDPHGLARCLFVTKGHNTFYSTSPSLYPPRKDFFAVSLTAAGLDRGLFIV